MGQAKPLTKLGVRFREILTGSELRKEKSRPRRPPPRWKRIMGQLFEIFIFIFVLAVFAFSLYKILTISGVVKPVAYGFSGNPCDRSRRDWEWDWCNWEFDPCPTKTPTPSPVQSTPTPIPPFEPTPTPTLELGEPSSMPTPTSEPPPVGGGEPGPAGPPVCGATVPDAPVLLSADRSGPNEADLSWTEVGMATYYSLVYGLSSSNYSYGVSNTGRVTFFTVGGLDPTADYCFAVRAVNDCAPSDLSNEICTGASRGQVLGVSTLADTGGMDDEIFQLLFIIGSLCFGFGVKENSAKHLGRWQAGVKRRP